MNIIPVIEQFLTEIFTAAGDFMENPNDLCGLEEKIDRAGRNSNAKIMELILNESDKLICDSHSRRKKYTIQRHDKRTLITTFGDITFDHTYYRSRRSKRSVNSFTLKQMRIISIAKVRMPERRVTASSENWYTFMNAKKRSVRERPGWSIRYISAGISG